MPNAKFVVAFREAVKECRKEAESHFAIILPDATNFDLSKCIEDEKREIAKYLKEKFNYGVHDGTYESCAPVRNALWNDGTPPKIIKMKVARTQWGSAVVEIEVSNKLCSKNEFPIFKVCKDYEFEKLPNVDNF